MWRSRRAAWLFAVAALAVSLIPAACSPRRTPATLHDVAEAYVRIALQLAQHRPNLVDAWIGPAEWRPGPRVPVPDIRASLDRLLARVEAIRPRDLDPTEGTRLEYLRAQLRALSLVTTRLMGDTPPFAEEMRLAMGVDFPAPDSAALAHARAALDRELPGAAPLQERYWTFRRRFLIGEPDLERVLHRAIDVCRTATKPHITLPADDRVDVEFDDTLEWDAYAQYAGDHRTRLKIASRKGHDVAALLHMACHETYAGHHTQHILIDDALVRGRGWMEFELSPAFGLHLLISEGAAETGVDLALPEPLRASLYRDALLPLAHLSTADAARLAHVETLAATLEASIPPIVAAYLDNKASAEAAGKRLAEEALIQSPERFLAFAERNRSRSVAYPVGKAVVMKRISQASGEAERWRALQDLFTRKPFVLD